MPPFDPYTVLEVEKNAAPATIKKSYYRLSLQFHPDKAGPNGHEKFVRIQAAYEILSDESTRKWYDGMKSLETHHSATKGSSSRPDGPASKGRPPRQKRREGRTYTRKNTQFYEDKNPDEDPEDNEEFEAEDGEWISRKSRAWFEKGSTQPPTKKKLVKFRSRTWATKATKKAVKNLDALRNGIDDIKGRVSKHSCKSEPIQTLLSHISVDISYKKAEIANACEMMSAVVRGKWKDTPETQSILAVIYQTRDKIVLMQKSFELLEGLMQKIETSSEEERKRFKLLFRHEASLWGRDREGRYR